MRELIQSGLVEQTRRGLRKSNIYRLIPIYPIGIGQIEVPEPQFLRPKDMSLKTRQEEFDTYPHYHQNVDESNSIASMYIIDSLSPEKEKPICPAPLARLADDVGKEMRDKAPLSTRTRIARIHQKSGLSINEFMTEALAARTITRNRLGRIQKRNKNGQAQPMAYMLSVLGNRLNLGEKPHQMPLQPHESHNTRNSSLLPFASRPEPSSQSREAFWEAIRDATGLTDLKSYCHAAGRPPVYDDLRRSIQIVKEKR